MRTNKKKDGRNKDDVTEMKSFARLLIDRRVLFCLPGTARPTQGFDITGTNPSISDVGAG